MLICGIFFFCSPFVLYGSRSLWRTIEWFKRRKWTAAARRANGVRWRGQLPTMGDVFKNPFRGAEDRSTVAHT